jgi:hypothetical protein
MTEIRSIPDPFRSAEYRGAHCGRALGGYLVTMAAVALLLFCLFAMTADGAIIENRDETFPGNIPDGIGVGHCCYVRDGEVIYVYVPIEPTDGPYDPPWYHYTGPPQAPPVPPLPPVIPPILPPLPPVVPPVPPTPIPEPGTLALVGLAAVGMAWRLRR